MHNMAPIGPVYQAGTLSGNPVAVAAGMTTLKLVQEAGFYEKLGAASQRLVQGLTEAAQEHDIPFCGDAVGGMFGFYFSNSVPSTYAQMMAGDKERFNRFFHGMLDEGVYFAPAMFEAGFVSAQHSDAVIDETVEAARRVFKRIG
jgi:glutamate-1-semialdehyde 2,1-aminomutase